MKKNLLLVALAAITAVSFCSCGNGGDKKTNIEIKYTYGGQFFGDANITAKMEGWYAAGTEVVFACGGGIYTSAAEAAKNNNGKVIGVDVDQRPTIDKTYGAGITVTSAMKGLQNSVEAALGQYFGGHWANIGGKTDNLGLAKSSTGVDYVGIPTSEASWNFKNFTKDQYNAVVSKIRSTIQEPTSTEAKGSNLTVKNKIALVTDVGTIDDESFNQAAYTGVKAYGDANSIPYSYYQPSGDSDAQRIESIGNAVKDGAGIIVCPGYLFETSLYQVQNEYSDVAFILLDGEPHDSDYNYETKGNVYCAIYHEEQAGFLAGYAAVKEGYRKLGFLGGMAVPAVIRYGYGFVQGCNIAAEELNGKTFDSIEISANSDSNVKPTVSENVKVSYIA